MAEIMKISTRAMFLSFGLFTFVMCFLVLDDWTVKLLITKIMLIVGVTLGVIWALDNEQ